MIFTKHEIIARILKAQLRPIDSIIALVLKEYIKPPIPLPAAAILFAKDRRFENHCGTIPTLATNKKPIPSPNARPWQRKRCHIWLAQDAPKSPTVSRKIPMHSVFCVPNFLDEMVATGDMPKATEMERPPINANSRAVAPGNMLLAR
jgi:hypothetical protein